MYCPRCQNTSTKVIDSRETDNNRTTRRRRVCEKCEYRFTTYEKIDLGKLIIVKKDGTREPYDRYKLESGIWKSCNKRPVEKEMVDEMLDSLEEQWMSLGGELSSKVIGEAVIEKLRDIDEVAYIRFASVYRSFKDLESFEKELHKLLRS